MVQRISKDDTKYKTDTIPPNINDGSDKWVWSVSKVVTNANMPNNSITANDGNIEEAGRLYTRKNNNP